MINFDPRPIAVELIINLHNRGLTYANAETVLDWVRQYLDAMEHREFEHLPLAEGVSHPFDVGSVRPSALKSAAITTEFDKFKGIPVYTGKIKERLYPAMREIVGERGEVLKRDILSQLPVVEELE